MEEREEQCYSLLLHLSFTLPESLYYPGSLLNLQKHTHKHSVHLWKLRNIQHVERNNECVCVCARVWFAVCIHVSLSYDWCLSSHIRRLKTNGVEEKSTGWRREKKNKTLSLLRGPKPFSHLTSKPSQCHVQAASSVSSTLRSSHLLSLIIIKSCILPKHVVQG